MSPVTNKTTFTVFRYKPLAIRVINPFRSELTYSYVFWYQYEVAGQPHWGKFRCPVAFATPREANEAARDFLGHEIEICYDPKNPQDSRPKVMPAPREFRRKR